MVRRRDRHLVIPPGPGVSLDFACNARRKAESPAIVGMPETRANADEKPAMDRDTANKAVAAGRMRAIFHDPRREGADLERRRK
jgi:hypothetical protein